VKALVIAATELRRLVRWRANLFFLFILPMLIILLLGATFGGADSARIGVTGVTDTPLAARLVASLDAERSVEIVRYTSESALRHDVARGTVEAGLRLPADLDRRLRAGETAAVSYFARPDTLAQQVRAAVEAAVAGEGAVVAAAQLVVRERGVSFAVALQRASTAAGSVKPVSVDVTAADGSPYTATVGRFESGASTQLLLFIFLTSLNGALWLIETRRLGVARRMLSTPTSVGTIIAGQLLGRLAVALLQALIIMLGAALFFGVSWGDPFGAAAVVLAFSLVGTGAAMLLGSLFATEQQAGPVAFMLGLGLAAFGGSMVPLEVFPGTMRTIAHVTPHAWGNDAFSELIAHGGNLVDVAPQVGVLLGFAAAALALALWRFRRVLTA